MCICVHECLKMCIKIKYELGKTVWEAQICLKGLKNITKFTGVKPVVNLEAVCRENFDQNKIYEILKESKNDYFKSISFILRL